jgi:PAS domain S-box-containing protein
MPIQPPPASHHYQQDSNMSTPGRSKARRLGKLIAALLLLALPVMYRKQKLRRAQKNNRSHGIIQSANDAIITTDEKQTILEANPAAAAMFGTTVQAMQGTALDKFVPRDLRTMGEQYPAGEFGDTSLNLRMMGRRTTDYAMTGLKVSGEQFPLEGSISSRIEDNKPIYIVILRDITERKQVQQQLEQSFSQLRQLSTTLQNIREEERKHIARELHDDLGQLLATLRLDLTLLQQSTPSAETQRILRGMDNLILTAITSLRRIASNLRPRALDEGGLYFALQSLRQEFIQRHAINFDLLADEADLTLDDDYSTAIYRIVQESLTNIARHAQARNVTVALNRADSHLVISIQDDGRGIEGSDMAKSSSFGLLGMRERVLGLHGDISISGNGGTRIDIMLPLLPEMPPQNPASSTSISGGK